MVQAYIYRYWATALTSSRAGDLLAPLLVAGLQAPGAGLLEDTTKRLGAQPRLLATVVSGVFIGLLTGAALNHLDIPPDRPAARADPGGRALHRLCHCRAGNAIKLLDGVNGLAGGVGCSATISALATSVGDPELATTAALLAAATAGFWLVNFPFGRLFLGDGGAYFGGFALTWLAVQLPMRYPDVSPWHTLLACAHPVIETLYSSVRRLWAAAGSIDTDPSCLRLPGRMATCQ